MKTVLTLIMLVLASPLLAQEQAVSEQVMKVALTSLRYHPFVVFPGEDLDAARFVVSDATIGGAETRLRYFLDSCHGKQVADEMFASYQSNSAEVQRLKTEDVSSFKVTSLDDFNLGLGGYSWPALHETFPQVQSVVRVSLPAFDSLGTFAVVRYERIRENEPDSASFFEFVKNPDGSWRQTHGGVGFIHSE